METLRDSTKGISLLASDKRLVVLTWRQRVLVVENRKGGLFVKTVTSFSLLKPVVT